MARTGNGSVCILVANHVASRSVYAVFTQDLGQPMTGDNTLEDLRTHGKDPQYRKSIYASVVTHLTILVLIPWILQLGGCITPYKVPKGSGNPVVAMVKMVKPKKKKSRLSLFVRTRHSLRDTRSR